MTSFRQWLAEKEEIFAVQKYTTGESPGKQMAKGAIRPANPSKFTQPFQGMQVVRDFKKDSVFSPAYRPPSGTIHPKK